MKHGVVYSKHPPICSLLFPKKVAGYVPGLIERFSHVHGWLGGLVVSVSDSDRQVAGSTPGRRTVRQQLWASC